jgi:hypothetical protein
VIVKMYRIDEETLRALFDAADRELAEWITKGSPGSP